MFERQKNSILKFNPVTTFEITSLKKINDSFRKVKFQIGVLKNRLKSQSIFS